MWRLFREYLTYIRQERKWWLVPLAALLLLLGGILVLGSTTGLGWAIYPFM